MLTWGDFKGVLRRMLSDEVTPYLTSEEILEDSYRWATRQFAAHTAPMAEYTFDSTVLKTSPATFYDMAEDYVFTLPGDVFENPELTGFAYWRQEGKNTILPPVRTSPEKTTLFGTVPGYFTYYRNGRWQVQVNVSSQLAEDSLTVVYYSYYGLPADDADELEIPDWAEKAVSYLCGANALNHRVMETSGTNQFNEVQELRGMELNGWRLQQKHFNAEYALEISHYLNQNRKAVIK